MHDADAPDNNFAPQAEEPMTPPSEAAAPASPDPEPTDSEPTSIPGADEPAEPVAQSTRPVTPGPRLLGLPRKLTMTLLALVGLAVVATVVFFVTQYVQEQRELHDAASAEYDKQLDTFDTAVADYRAAQKEFDDSISTLKASDLGEDNAAGKDLLETAQLGGQHSAQGTELLTPESIELEDSSIEEIETATEKLGKTQSEIDDYAANYVASTELLEAGQELREEARREARVAKEKKNAKTISYESLFRSGDDTYGTYYRFTGKVIQDAGSDQYRISITQDPGYSRIFWEDPIYVGIEGTPSESILEDDIVTFVGMSLGVTSYESIFGQTIKIPLVRVDANDISVTGRDD